MEEEMLNKIYEHCSNNKEELLKSEKCGCFNCLTIFDPKEIFEWIEFDEGEYTAFCPYCAIDSILPESDEYELTEDLLKKMHKRWMES